MKSLLKRLPFYLLCLFALIITGYSVVGYGIKPIGSLVHPDMRNNFQTQAGIVYLHVFASSIALLLGTIQFSQRLRERHLHFHRWIGRIYLLLGVLLGGCAGLVLAQTAFGGLPSQVGFSALAILWLYSGLRAYLAIRRGRIQEHRQWMTRNYALTCAAITLRLYLVSSIASDLPFNLAYPAIAWLCWVPNLAYAEWLIHRQQIASLR